MLQPNDLKNDYPMTIPGGKTVSNSLVWEILAMSYAGNLERMKELIAIEPNLAYAQYNYMPPIHLAVREGHLAMVQYLLSLGAYDPDYKTYPFLDNLVQIAIDREYSEIQEELIEFGKDITKRKFRGDNGEIHYPRTTSGKKFEQAVDQNNLQEVEKILKEQPELAKDETFFWGEGILMMPAKEVQIPLLDLLFSNGATIPTLLKWAQGYYFEREAGAEYMLKKGINPNIMSCHHVKILHDIAQKGSIEKARLLLAHDADIDPVEEEYQSTPLGLATRWGQEEMVRFLLENGADPNKSGAHWSTPLSWSIKKGHALISQMLKAAGATG